MFLFVCFWCVGCCRELSCKEQPNSILPHVKTFNVNNSSHIHEQRHLTLSLPECLMESCKVTLAFESVDEILWCDHSNESSLPVLSHDAICFPQLWKMKFGNLVETCLWPHLTVKGLTTLYFLQQSFATCNNLICCTEGSNMGGKRRKHCYSTCFAAMLQN